LAYLQWLPGRERGCPVGNMSIGTPFVDNGGLGTFFKDPQLKELKDL